MTTELWCLVAFALWGLVLVSIDSLSKTRLNGPKWGLGNRDTQPELPAWLQRTARAIANHKENFPLFATAIVVVTLVGRTNTITAWAAIIYLVARVLHGVIYIAGLTTVRTLVWLVALVANLAILGQLVV
jgi:uncharacterized MAPEG superfamily protein